jgi:biopolymer transport protein ExbD
MNFANGRSEEGNEFELNITPLLDVMFLLVIFFAVSTTFRAYTGISIDLPAAQSERIREEKKTITVVLSEQGEVYVDGEKTSSGHLSGILKDRLREFPNLVFVLQADEKARHGQVVELMDTAKQAGISRLAIATRQKESKTGDGAGNDPADEKKRDPAGDR